MVSDRYKEPHTMEKICVEYQITVSDFRQATYYGLFLRHRTALRIMFVVLAVAVIYVIAGSLGLGTINPLVLFLGLAYLIWGLFLFAGAEKGIRAYLRSEGSMIGCTYRAELEAHRIRLEVPERDIHFTTPVHKLTCVFEFSNLFLLYTSLQDVYLLPARCLTQAQRAALRANFRNRLGENFGSRFR